MCYMIQYAQIFLNIEGNIECLPCQNTNIKIDHVFSVEKDDRKRFVLMKATSARHCFDNVRIFEAGKGYCHVTHREVKICTETCGIDILISGPACTNLSLLNKNRSSFASCYEQNEEGEVEGVSAETYLFGFKKVSKPVLSNILLLYCIHLASQD